MARTITTGCDSERDVRLVDGEVVHLRAGDLLVVEPGEVHTFSASSEDYLHFVVQAPFVPGDKRSP